MAGYLFAFSDEDSMKNSMKAGWYSTLVNSTWTTPIEATLADYITMQPGDNVYFFSKRKIYGIGEIVSIKPGLTIMENYPKATSGEQFNYSYLNFESIIKPSNQKKVNRWIIAFKPAPKLFSEGIDMDDLLAKENPIFKSLRVFENRSFIKLNGQENAAFKSALLRTNLDTIYGLNDNSISCNYEDTISKLKNKAENRELDIYALLKNRRKKNGSLSREMLLEVGLLYQLSIEDKRTIGVFGKWDYLSHQVHASPMKPIKYMDTIDVFGYKWIEDFKPIIEKYLVVELKKGKISGEDISQIMKYVDWVRSEYAEGDYSMIKAFLVGKEIDLESVKQEIVKSERNYVIGARPASSRKWSDLSFVVYYVEENGYISFSTVKL